MRKMKLCFVSLSSYPLIANRTDIKIVGGAEVQQTLLAKYLKQNFIISFITYDFGQMDGEKIDGITIYKTFPIKNETGIFEKIKRVNLLWKALKKANADIYLVRGIEWGHEIVAIFCKLKKRRFIHAIALDYHITTTYLKGKSFIGKLLYKYVLKNAALIIAQSRYQYELLRNNFNLSSEVIKNGINLPKAYDKESIMHENILWVATMRELKRPFLFLNLAKRFPHVKFRMIGGRDLVYGEEELYNKIVEKTKNIPNIEYLDFKPYQMVKKYFQEAFIFVNTSKIEGFPNTFLQAWSNYVPVVSLYVDPDECICNNKVGIHSRTFDRMVEDLQRIFENMGLWREMSYNARKYVEREHNMEIIAERYTKLLLQIGSEGRGKTKNPS